MSRSSRPVRATRLGGAVASLALLAGCSSDPSLAELTAALAPPVEPDDLRPALDRRRYPEASFAATHNSYALAGGLLAQLESGVRMLELDVHDDDYAEHGFRVGHLRPGAELSSGGGNPDSPRLEAWLDVLARWSDHNPRHAPLTLALDLKDGVGENEGFAEGDLGALNAALERAFGARLFRASELEARAWPTLGELRGRVLVVLSGDEPSRLAYRGDRGARPAVGMNAHGVVVEAHDTGDGRLASWTGVYQADGRVAWRRHAVYDTGKNPAIDVNDDGLVVEVHEDPDHQDDQLWYRVGRLDADLEIRWFAADGLEFPGRDEGRRPTLRFTRGDASAVREVHESEITGRRWSWDGDFDPATRRMVWTRKGSGRTEAPRFTKARARARGASVEVYTTTDGAFGTNTLMYGTDRAGPSRVRPEQLAFVELQHGNDAALEGDGLLFAAGPADSASARLWAAGWHAAGKVARLWSFNAPALTAERSVNFPATDEPFAGWYVGYRTRLSAAR